MESTKDKKRKVYGKRYKLQAVKQVVEEGKKLGQVAKDLGIIETMLSRWIREYKQNGAAAFSGHGNPVMNKDYEISKLSKRVKQLELENEILKKYDAFLREQRRKGTASSKSTEDNTL
ncbi:MAG: Transposase [Firmicutes bacterium ADurb.Bin153]|nr:MAG: Transposase [Firmicutes bacterium ADurb.Bin153]